MKPSTTGRLGLFVLLALGFSAAGGGLAGCASSGNREVAADRKPVMAAPKLATEAELEAASEPAGDDAANQPAEKAPAGGAGSSSEADASAADATSPDATSPGADASVSWPRSADPGPDDIANYAIGSVAGRKIPLSDLVAKWIWREPARVRAILDDLVLSRVIVFEAAALQIELPDGALEKAVEARLVRLEQQAKASGKPSMEAYIQETLGMSPPTYMKYAQEESAIDLLAPRCVRSWILMSDHREIRALTVKTKEEVEEVQRRLADGEPFENVARELSVDPSKVDGGRLPPVVRGGNMVLARAAFAADVGEVSGPIKERDGFLFVKVEAAPEPLTGGWPDVGAAVEASLTARPVEDPEFWQWKNEILGRYDISMEPFLDLVK